MPEALWHNLQLTYDYADECKLASPLLVWHVFCWEVQGWKLSFLKSLTFRLQGSKMDTLHSRQKVVKTGLRYASEASYVSRCPKLVDCAFGNFGNSSGTEGEVESWFKVDSELIQSSWFKVDSKLIQNW